MGTPDDRANPSRRPPAARATHLRPEHVHDHALHERSRFVPAGEASATGLAMSPSLTPQLRYRVQNRRSELLFGGTSWFPVRDGFRRAAWRRLNDEIEPLS